MNIISSNLKTSFVQPLLPAMCPSQRMQFHHSTSPLKSLIGKNVLSGSHNRIFKNPNVFSHKRENAPSNYDNTNRDSCDMSPFEPRNHTTENHVEKTNFGQEIPVEPSLKPSRKRTRRVKSKPSFAKSPEKHNTNRQIVNELMDISSDSMDYSFDSIIDEDMEDCHPTNLKLCDLVVIPNHSSPLPVFDLSTKCPLQTACFTLSISPPTTRQRQFSTTESEDSFIVFESGTDEECDFSDEDVCSEIEEGSNEDDGEASDSDSPSSVVPTKKVRFAKDLCEVHPMIKWSFAYQAARKGPWEVYARDRERFKNRIRHVGEKIGHCFEPEHRQKIYDQRFEEKMDD